MVELLEGLELHEILLMFLGVILFLVLFFVLVYFVIKNRPFKGLLKFFLLPVIMIGFSAIQKIEFMGLIADLNNKIEEVNQKGTPTEEDKKEISDLLADIEDESVSSTNNFLSISRANAILGDTLKALDYVEQVLVKNPNNKIAKDLRLKYISPTIIEKSIDNVEKSPDNPKLRNDLIDRTKVLEGTQKSTPEKFFAVAKASKVLGDTLKAVKFVDSALTLKPAFNDAKNLKIQLLKKP